MVVDEGVKAIGTAIPDVPDEGAMLEQLAVFREESGPKPVFKARRGGRRKQPFVRVVVPSVAPAGGKQIEQPVVGGAFARDGRQADDAVFILEGLAAGTGLDPAKRFRGQAQASGAPRWPAVAQQTRHRHLQWRRRGARMAVKAPLRWVARLDGQQALGIAGRDMLPVIGVVGHLGESAVGNGDLFVERSHRLIELRCAAIGPERRNVLWVVWDQRRHVAVELGAEVQGCGQVAHAIHGDAALAPSGVAGFPPAKPPFPLEGGGVVRVFAVAALPEHNVAATGHSASAGGRELEELPAVLAGQHLPEAKDELGVVAGGEALIRVCPALQQGMARLRDVANHAVRIGLLAGLGERGRRRVIESGGLLLWSLVFGDVQPREGIRTVAWPGADGQQAGVHHLAGDGLERARAQGHEEEPTPLRQKPLAQRLVAGEEEPIARQHQQQFAATVAEAEQALEEYGGQIMLGERIVGLAETAKALRVLFMAEVGNVGEDQVVALR